MMITNRLSEPNKKNACAPTKYAIIGGGLSGTLCAIHLLKRADPQIEITIFEKEEENLFRGNAYSSVLAHQMLNVSADQMSLFITKPFHFSTWLKQKNYPYSNKDFVPRNIYGSYITETYNTHLQSSPSRVHKVVSCAVIDIQSGSDCRMDLTLENYQVYRNFSYVFICTGNALPANQFGFPQQFRDAGLYFANPWSGQNMEQIKKKDNLLIIGSGLSMVDQVLSLQKKKHEGQYFVLSRRGLLPQPYTSSKLFRFSELPDLENVKIGVLFKWLRQEILKAKNQGIDWQNCIDALREYTTQIWQSLSEADKKSFYTHLMCYWDVHRHRIPTESHSTIRALQDKGIVQIFSGRLINWTFDKNFFLIQIRKRGTQNIIRLTVDKIINCTGPQSPISAPQNHLYRQLIEQEKIVADSLDMGVVVNDLGNPINKKGIYNPHIFFIGPPAKGTHFECTALKEIRKQVYHIFKILAKQKTA